MVRIFRFLKHLSLSCLILVLSGFDAPVFADAPLKKEEIRQIVREYLLENPEIMLEVQQALQLKQQAELSQNQAVVLRENEELLYNSQYQINFGDENAEVTVVEFFDYNCGFCQRAMADMQQFLEYDRNVRFVLKEFPVLGEASVEASQVSMAFSELKPDLYGEFHIALLSMDGIKDGERAIQLAQSMGVSRQEVEQKMESIDISQAIQDIYVLAEGLGISGTPSYVVGSEVVFGAVGYDQLKTTLERQTN